MARTARKSRTSTSAKKPTAGKTRARKGSAPMGDPAERLRAALLHLLATQGWRDLSLAAIAEEAGLDMAQAHEVYPTKAAILLALARATDNDILESLKEDPLEGGTRDRLFDLLMRRFDHLQQQRDAYATLLRELPHTPPEAAMLSCQVRRSLALMLETAGLSASGLKGMLRVQGLMMIYLAGLRVWSRDDSEDLAKTMAEIDKRLGQAARISEMCAPREQHAAA